MDTESLLYLMNLEEKIDKIEKKLGGGVRTDIKGLRTFAKDVYYKGNIISVTGKGYIKRLIVKSKNHTLNSIEIVIDGTVIKSKDYYEYDNIEPHRKMLVIEDICFKEGFKIDKISYEDESYIYTSVLYYLNE